MLNLKQLNNSSPTLRHSILETCVENFCRGIQSHRILPSNTYSLKTRSFPVSESLGLCSSFRMPKFSIVNISFLNMIAYKTHECYLFPPFNAKPFKVSRQYGTIMR